MKLETSTLRADFCDSGRRVILSKPYTVTLDDATFEIPAGFVTDFASVPRAFWRIVPPWGRYFPAAIVHDYLYSIHDRPKEAADKIFLLIMEALKIPAWRRHIMYRAVRWFGGRAWRDGKAPPVQIK